MAVDHIRYDLLTQQALRGVVRAVLSDTAKTGLVGEHHFYIAFDTRAPGVRISPRLKEQYPEEMTIILQHQFWDLKVTPEGFEVGLSFGGVPERLGVPFEAVRGFFDPSVQFGLQFEATGEAAGEEGAAKPEASKGRTRPPAVAQPRADSVTEEPALPAAATPSSPPAAEEAKPGPSAGAEVVRLDRFRKK